MIRASRTLLCLASVALLILAFPPFDQPWCAWVALVPWLRLLEGARARAAFWWSWAVGFGFFLGSIWWLTHVTVFGWLALCAFLALYFGAFGALARSALRRSRPAAALAILPAGWMLLEWLRSRLLSGFGWNLLAYSQTSWPVIIQCADLAGAWGVSGLMVGANVALFLRARRSPPRGARAAAAIAAGLIVAALGYGAWRLAERQSLDFPRNAALSRVEGRQPASPRPVRVAVLQGNIPQDEKWDEEHKGPIMDQYEALARRAAASHADLIVWPETSMPGFLDLDEPLTRRLRAIAASVHVPMLVGVPVSEGAEMAQRLLNSAALLAPDGRQLGRYDKLHLVPFGEYIPFERRLPWARQALPPIGEFVGGDSPTVFRLPGDRPAAFSVLICFEDVFPELARAFVRHGAQFLLVITNDAWFGPTAAARQHAQASAFRAVELRRPVARAANTGWSGCIDAAGRLQGRVQDREGRELFVTGTTTCDMEAGSRDTLYARWGDWLILGSAGLLAGWLARRVRRRSKRRRSRV